VKTYELWLRRFLRFHNLRHPREMGSAEVNSFLTHLAVDLQVSPSTQNQALAALLFLYRELLDRDLELDGVVRARNRRRLPVVLSEAEVRAVREHLEGDPALVVGLLYGSGLRLMEALRLRVKDLDFERRELFVRDGKGGKDRLTLLPQSLVAELQHHLLGVRRLHQLDLAAGWGRVLMPYALARKYPNAALLARSNLRHPGTPPSGSEHRAEGREAGHHGCWRVQSGQLPYLPPLVCHPPAGARPGHPDDPGIAGPQGREHHDDLHPRTEPWANGRAQPRRHSVAGRTCDLRTREPRLD
jgi:hypothetical protein